MLICSQLDMLSNGTTYEPTGEGLVNTRHVEGGSAVSSSHWQPVPVRVGATCDVCYPLSVNDFQLLAGNNDGWSPPPPLSSFAHCRRPRLHAIQTSSSRRAVELQYVPLTRTVARLLRLITPSKLGKSGHNIHRGHPLSPAPLLRTHELAVRYVQLQCYI